MTDIKRGVCTFSLTHEPHSFAGPIIRLPSGLACAECVPTVAPEHAHVFTGKCDVCGQGQAFCGDLCLPCGAALNGTDALAPITRWVQRLGGSAWRDTVHQHWGMPVEEHP